MIRSQTSVTEVRTPSVDALLVAIPAYNEDRFIGSLVLKLRRAGLRVVVVDDGSTDETASLAEAAGADVLRHSANQGKSAAVRTAFEYARRAGAEVVVLLDGDGQHAPEDVMRLAKPVQDGQADMVVGSRFAGTRSEIPRWRVAGQHALTLATNLGSGSAVSDSQSGFRAFSRRAIETMTFSKAGFSVESEMQFEARAHDLRVTELPILVRYDSPLKRSPLGQGVNVLDAVLRLVAQHRPLLFFGVPGLLCLVAGLALGRQVVLIYDTTLRLAVGYSLMTVLLCVVGVLAIFTGIMLHTLQAVVRDVSRRP